MLAEKLENHPNATVLFNHEVVDFKQNEGVVVVSIKYLGNIKKLNCHYLVGADGANSIVRRLLRLGFDGFTYKEKFLTLSTKYNLAKHFENLSFVIIILQLATGEFGRSFPLIFRSQQTFSPELINV